jgi:hypothetical protein
MLNRSKISERELDQDSTRQSVCALFLPKSAFGSLTGATSFDLNLLRNVSRKEGLDDMDATSFVDPRVKALEVGASAIFTDHQCHSPLFTCLQEGCFFLTHWDIFSDRACYRL